MPPDALDDLQLHESDIVAARRVEGAVEVSHAELRGRKGSILTIPLICIGVALVAACLLVPAADENRRLAYEREGLQRDLEQLDRQIEVNTRFIRQLTNDPTLSERLARRQLQMRGEGVRTLDIEEPTDRFTAVSPYALLQLPAPAPLAPYEPVGGRLGELCRDPQKRLYLIGAGLFSVLCGLLLSSSSLRPRSAREHGVSEGH